MEENKPTEQNNGDVSPDAVAKVIAENGNKNEGYKDLSETDAKSELDQIVAPENPAPAIQPAAQPAQQQAAQPATVPQPVEVPQPSVNLAPQPQTGSLPITNQPEEVQPQANNETQEPVEMQFLQFKCGSCGFKSYTNLEDDEKLELPEKMKCINCGKKKAVKTIILDIVWRGFKPYKIITPVSPPQ